MTIHTQLMRLAAITGLATALAAPAFAQEIVKIGYSGPLSGGAALYGKHVLDGMRMAVDEINAAGFEVAGKKYKLEIVALDDKYNPSETAINAQRLVQEHKTPAIVVPHSGGTYALQTTNEQQKYLVLAHTSVPQVVNRGNKLTLRIPAEFTTYSEAFIKYAMAKHGKNLAIASADHDYAKAWVASFKPMWEAAGGKVVGENPMSYIKATDYYSGVSRALASKPDVLFVGGPSEPTALVVKQARDLGFKGGFVVLDQARVDEMAKVLGGFGSLEGSIGVLPFTDVPIPAARAFIERFNKAHPGQIASWEASLNYIGVQLLAQAMKQAGTVSDAVAIRANLDAAAKQLPGSANLIELRGVDERGASTMGTFIAVVEGGKVVPRTGRDFR